MEPGYRKHRLMEMPSVLDSDFKHFEKLARMSQLDYYDIILQSLLNYINTEVIPKSAGILINSLCQLLEGDEEKSK